MTENNFLIQQCFLTNIYLLEKLVYLVIIEARHQAGLAS